MNSRSEQEQYALCNVLIHHCPIHMMNRKDALNLSLTHSYLYHSGEGMQVWAENHGEELLKLYCLRGARGVPASMMEMVSRLESAPRT